jgi:hypothetical protein
MRYQRLRPGAGAGRSWWRRHSMAARLQWPFDGVHEPGPATGEAAAGGFTAATSTRPRRGRAGGHLPRERHGGGCRLLGIEHAQLRCGGDDRIMALAAAEARPATSGSRPSGRGRQTSPAPAASVAKHPRERRCARRVGEILAGTGGRGRLSRRAVRDGVQGGPGRPRRHLPFLDPFAADFEYRDGKVVFHRQVQRS